jgi:segregation and condensation protein B
MAETSVIRLFPSAGLRAPEANAEHLRMAEAILFASAEPVALADLAQRLPASCDVPALLADLQQAYAARGVNLVQVAGRWAFRTAPDLAFLMNREAVEQKKLSRAAMETLAIIAYHQPVTRADIEEIRGVSTSSGTLDVLIETGWVRLRGRRKTPGRPVTYGTTPAFLEHFGLEAIADLPGLDELKAAGLLNAAMDASGFALPQAGADLDLAEDEEPLGADDPDADFPGDDRE